MSPSDRPALNSVSQLELSVALVDGLAALNAKKNVMPMRNSLDISAMLARSFYMSPTPVFSWTDAVLK